MLRFRNIFDRSKSKDVETNLGTIYLRSRLFDASWYLRNNPDVALSGTPPLTHYIKHGWQELRDPGPFFSVKTYLTLYSDVKAAGVEPLYHFISCGAKERRTPNPAFDAAWYVSFYNDMQDVENPLLHFLDYGSDRGDWPHPLLDLSFAASARSFDASKSRLAVFRALLERQGGHYGPANEYFDCDEYISSNQDVERAGIHPLLHFHRFGWREGRDPGSKFSTSYYLREHPDVRESGMNPLEHFIHYGKAKGYDPVKNSINSENFDKRLVINQLQLRLKTFLASSMNLEFAIPQTPKISVIIVTFNKAFFTLRCLESLLLQSILDSTLRMEVIVYDNASTDETHELLAKTKNITIVRGAENVGFLKAVNMAADRARGQYLLLLNNDTELAAGAIRNAMKAFDSERVGAVGGKLVLPNGSVQEAGNIIWRDGSCIAYRRGADPEDPEISFRRDVDYCSGAFLLTKLNLFNDLGRFNEALSPAYYEETDFCIRLQNRGLRVIYDPSVLVFHFEFGSSNDNSYAVKLQERNKEVIQDLHKAYLSLQHPPGTEMLAARHPRHISRRILMIDDRVPHDWLGAGFPRAKTLISTILSLLGSKGCLTLLTTDERQRDWAIIRTTLPPEVEIAFATSNAEFTRFMSERWTHYDTILVSRPHNMLRLKEFIRSIGSDIGQKTIVYDAEAIFANREFLRAQIRGTGAQDLDKAIDEEVALGTFATEIFAVSDLEAKEFRSRTRARVHVLGHALAPKAEANSFSSRNGFLFVGPMRTAESPNGDSVIWLLSEIWPLIRAAHPEADLTIVGERDLPEIDSLDLRGVSFVHSVQSLSSYYSSARVFVAPTRFAAGIPLKVHEACAFGVPVVCTQLLCDQLGWRDGVEVLAASDPHALAERLTRLHSDERLWRTIREGALAAVKRDCDPGRFDRVISMALHLPNKAGVDRPIGNA